MSDEKKRVAEKLLNDLGRSSSGGKCASCGSSGSDIDIFECESCGVQICTNCHIMSDDLDLLCQKCGTEQ